MCNLRNPIHNKGINAKNFTYPSLFILKLFHDSAEKHLVVINTHRQFVTAAEGVQAKRNQVRYLYQWRSNQSCYTHHVGADVELHFLPVISGGIDKIPSL